MILPMVALVLLQIAGRTYAADGENGEKRLNFYKLYDSDLGKRAAYSYVSEFKRLPVYNFGLGKRSPREEHRLYSFGLGKRSYEPEDDYEDTLRDELSKRVKQYSFGLGKRAMKQYSFGLGKRPDVKMYSLGLGKRSSFDYEPRNFDDYDNFDEMKRGADENRRLYSFGLGKRDRDDESRQGRSMMYNFGLGKRSEITLPDKEASSSRTLAD